MSTPKDSRSSHPSRRYSAYRASMTEGYIRVDRATARAVGGVDVAAFFHELAWRSEDERYVDADGWIDVTAAELEESAVLTRRQQERVRKTLRDLGVIEEQRVGIPAQLYYRIDWDTAEELVAASGESRYRAVRNRVHRSVNADAPNGATRRTTPAKPDAPNGASYIRLKNSKEQKESSSSSKTNRIPLVTRAPIWDRLDPNADRSVILRNRLERPEVPALADVDGDHELVGQWMDVQEAWDERHGR